jgi:sugar phosphate isomerase/epimerase
MTSSKRQGDAMKFGIFESIFPEPDLEGKIARVAGFGFSCVQLDLASAGLATLPDDLPADTFDLITGTLAASGIEIAALAGTFNMIDPDLERRAANVKRMVGHIARAPMLGASVVTICTGTRDMDSMWKHHPDNATPEAWRDLVKTLTSLLEIAARHNVTLGIEPEPANVISNAALARKLLDDTGSANLGIIADPANLLAGDLESDPVDVLERAFDLLGDRLVLAHGKDLDSEGRFTPAGKGVVPWTRFRELLDDAGYNGALVLHSLTVDDIPYAIETLGHAGFAGIGGGS